MVKNVLLNVLPQTQAYVSSDAGTMNQLRAVDDGAIKIPYRIFVGGIAFNVSKALFLLYSGHRECTCNRQTFLHPTHEKLTTN